MVYNLFTLEASRGTYIILQLDREARRTPSKFETLMSYAKTLRTKRDASINPLNYSDQDISLLNTTAISLHLDLVILGLGKQVSVMLRYHRRFVYEHEPVAYG